MSDVILFGAESDACPHSEALRVVTRGAFGRIFAQGSGAEASVRQAAAAECGECLAVSSRGGELKLPPACLAITKFH